MLLFHVLKNGCRNHFHTAIFFINYMILYIEHFCCHIPYVLLRENLSAPSSIRILALPQLGLRD